MTAIEANQPHQWLDLQNRVAQILRECGLEAEINAPVKLARGSANVDVYARDPKTTPPSTIICECKLWKKRVPKEVVHAFRSVLADSGANIGLIVSKSGAQRGALEAAEHTNVQILDWAGFEGVFAERWFSTYWVPRVKAEAEPLLEYTEPINSRIFRKADALSEPRRAEFRSLREKHFGPAFGLLPVFFPLFADEPPLPQLPIRSALTVPDLELRLPADVLDAVALRPLMDALVEHYRAAIAEFDAVFGERA